jgi:hypothetical protein
MASLPVNPSNVYLWHQDITVTKKQILQLKKNKKCMHTPVIGRCLPNLESKLHGSAAYAKANAKQDVVQLLLIACGYC